MPLPDELTVTKSERRETVGDLVGTTSDRCGTRDDLAGMESDSVGIQVGFPQTGVNPNAVDVNESSRTSNRAWDELGTPANLGRRSGGVICRT